MQYQILVLLLVFARLLRASNKFPDRIISKDGKPVKWTADWPVATKVEFYGAKKLSLELHCDLLNAVHSCAGGEKPKRSKTEFCFIDDSNKKKCHTLKEGDSFDVKLGDVIGKATFDIKSGAKVVFSNIEQDKEFPRYHAVCTDWTDRNTFLKSNQIFILDFRKNFPKEVWKPTEAPQLNRNSESRVKCLQKGLGIDEKLKKSSEPSVSVKFEWFLCSGDTVAACDESKKSFRDVARFLDWPVQVLADGELYVPFVPADKESQLQNKRLVCYLMNEPVAFYSSPVKLVNSAKTGTELEMIRPPRREQIILYNSSDYSITLPCLFKTSGPVSSIGWNYKIGGKTTPLSAGKTDNDRKVTVSAQSDSITLNGPFSEKTEGYYSCQVVQGNNPVLGNYHILVNWWPLPSAEIANSKYSIEGDKAKLRCGFQAANARQVKLGLSVNGKRLNLKTDATIKKDVEDINSASKEWATPISFEVQPVNPSGTIISYTEPKTAFDKSRDSTHVVTCIAEKAPFKIRTHVVFRTTPRPKLNLDVPAACRDSCQVTAKLENADEFAKKCVKVSYSWSKTASCPSKEKSEDGGAVFNYAVSSSGNASVCACVQLRSPEGQLFGSECRAGKMQASLSFWSASNPWMWVVILAILVGIAAIVVAVVYFHIRKQMKSSQSDNNEGYQLAPQA